MNRLVATDITVGYKKESILKDISFTIPDGKITTIIGPNGCGKSTTLKSLVRILQPPQGTITLDNQPISSYKAKDFAREFSFLPQNPLVPDSITVRELVARGRHPYHTWYRQQSPDDDRLITWALEQTQTLALADRDVATLSGGQRQRVWIAMTVAQDTKYIFLDEPTTFLDLSHSLEVLHLVRQLCHTQGRTIVMVLHDINLAVRFSDHLIIMHNGSIAASGKPQEIITTDLMRLVFDLNTLIIPDPVTGGPLLVPIDKYTGE